MSDLRQDIVRHLRRGPLFAAVVADDLGACQSHTHAVLRRLIDEGCVARDALGRYQFVAMPAPKPRRAGPAVRLMCARLGAVVAYVAACELLDVAFDDIASDSPVPREWVIAVEDLLEVGY